MDKHVVKKTADANGNGDDVFRASDIKAYDRSASNHGYNTKQDQEVYEAKSKTLRDILSEKTLTSAEMKKREEVAKAIERDNPGMPMSKKMAIATATAKKVAEENDEEGTNALLEFVDNDGIQSLLEFVNEQENEPSIFDIFDEEIKLDIENVFEALTDENKQIMIEMIEQEEYDTVIEIVREIVNG